MISCHPTEHEITMSTGNVSPPACPRCESTNTIQTDHGRDYTSWYCYACGKSFEVYEGAMRRFVRGERRKKPTDRRQ